MFTKVNAPLSLLELNKGYLLGLSTTSLNLPTTFKDATSALLDNINKTLK